MAIVKIWTRAMSGAAVPGYQCAAPQTLIHRGVIVEQTQASLMALITGLLVLCTSTRVSRLNQRYFYYPSPRYIKGTDFILYGVLSDTCVLRFARALKPLVMTQADPHTTQIPSTKRT